MLIDDLRKLLGDYQGKEVTTNFMRQELSIARESAAWEGIRKCIQRLIQEKVIKPTARSGGTYKVIKQVKPVSVTGRKRKEPINLNFPRDFMTMEEMFFAKDILFREGDLILLSGRSNYGKTALCMSFCAENIDTHPVLMGNEYTTIDDEPSPRFLTRMDYINWVEWVNGDGKDKFILLPVRDDYAEHIIKDRINIIDWINLEEHYLISSVMEDIKHSLGKGIGIIAIQKAPDAPSGRGGQFTKDFADLEILLDAYGENEVLMTIGKVKEYRQKIVGRTFAYRIDKGVRIMNFREVVKCISCHGKGWKGNYPCEDCHKTGYIDK